MSSDKPSDIPVVMAAPPEYVRSPAEGNKPRRVTIALSVYAAAITALLVAMAVFGGIMYHQAMERCETENVVDRSQTTALQTKVDETEEDGHQVRKETKLDYERQTEIVHFASPGGAINGAVVVVDYRRSMTGLYFPDKEECYIIGGIDHHMVSPFVAMQDPTGMLEGDGVVQEDKQDTKESEKVNLVYAKAEDYPVLDASVLPVYLHTYCQGKPVYWLERTQEQDSDRLKRRWCIRVCWRFWCITYCR